MNADLQGALAAASSGLAVALLAELRARQAARVARLERAEERRVRLALLAQDREDELLRLAEQFGVERRRRRHRSRGRT